MRREFITHEELMSHMREQGIENVSNVKQACMEGDGRISIIEYGKKPGKKKKSREVTTA